MEEMDWKGKRIAGHVVHGLVVRYQSAIYDEEERQQKNGLDAEIRFGGLLNSGYKSYKRRNKLHSCGEPVEESLGDRHRLMDNLPDG